MILGATAGVTVAGTNQFNNNEYDGLDVYSNGVDHPQQYHCQQQWTGR